MAYAVKKILKMSNNGLKAENLVKYIEEFGCIGPGKEDKINNADKRLIIIKMNKMRKKL